MAEETIEEKIEENKNCAQCEEYLNGWKRAKADFINYQKDEARRFEHIIQFANESLIKDMIIALDTFELALANEQNKGFLIVRSQLEDILRKHGLEKIPVKIGDQFNPVYHESIAAADQPASNPLPANGIIAEEMGRGYTLQGKVIRPARVKIIQ